MKKGFLRGGTALDTSILVEVALATEHGKRFVELIVDEDALLYTSSLNVTEALYVLCRVLGSAEASKRVDLMLDSGYFTVISAERLSQLAAQCKCSFPLSLADCHSLALAKQYRIPVLFYRRERELEPLLEKLREWVGSELLFLAELLG